MIDQTNATKAETCICLFEVKSSYKHAVCVGRVELEISKDN